MTTKETVEAMADALARALDFQLMSNAHPVAQLNDWLSIKDQMQRALLRYRSEQRRNAQTQDAHD